MKAKYFIDGKKITKKALVARIGSKRVNLMTRMALSDYDIDPDGREEFILGGGDPSVLTIEIDA